jgi:hypothetical protein
MAQKRSATPPAWISRTADFSTPLLIFFSLSLLTFFLHVSSRDLQAGCEFQAEAASWPEAPGRIVDTSIETRYRSRSTTYRPVIRYAYETPRGTEGGSTIRFDESPWYSFKSDAEAARNLYPSGMAVRVKHHPVRMHISLLDAGPPRWSVLYWVRAALAVCLLAWVAFACFQLRRFMRWLRARKKLTRAPTRSSGATITPHRQAQVTRRTP